MEFETKNTEKYIVGKDKLIAVIKDNNPIPVNPAGRKGRSTDGNGSADGKSNTPNYVIQKRRRKAIHEKLNNNFDKEHSRFVTLTFDGERLGYENTTNLLWAHKEFAKFIKRINYRYDNFKFLATFARQKNGNWHYHMMCNFPPETTEREIKEMWKNGALYAETIADNEHYENVKKYIIKNMDSSAEELIGRKGYISSFNVKKDVRVCSWKKEDSEEFQRLSEKIIERGKDSVRLLSKTQNKTGVIREVINENTGEVTQEIITGVEMNDELQEAGFDELITPTEVYLSKGTNEDLFPAPCYAVAKQHKKNKRKGNSKKKNKPTCR